MTTSHRRSAGRNWPIRPSALAGTGAIDVHDRHHAGLDQHPERYRSDGGDCRSARRSGYLSRWMSLAPKDGKPTTRVNWLVRQLRHAPDTARLEAFVLHSRGPGTAELLKNVREQPGSAGRGPAQGTAVIPGRAEHASRHQARPWPWLLHRLGRAARSTPSTATSCKTFGLGPRRLPGYARRRNCLGRGHPSPRRLCRPRTGRNLDPDRLEEDPRQRRAGRTRRSRPTLEPVGADAPADDPESASSDIRFGRGDGDVCGPGFVTRFRGGQGWVLGACRVGSG